MIFETVQPEKLRIDMRELAARLGTPHLTSLRGMEELVVKLYREAKPSYAATRVKLKRDGDGIIIGNTLTHSTSLSALCHGCDECIFLAVTLGVGVDRLLMRMEAISPADAFVIDALADALTEALADYAEDRVCEGLCTTGRFSPGYGDLELSLGREILDFTNAGRLLGIKLTQSGMMVPKKSVNAIIGVRNDG